MAADRLNTSDFSETSSLFFCPSLELTESGVTFLGNLTGPLGLG